MYYAIHNTFIPMLELIIDFDKASEMWKANKTSIGNGSYKYVCGAVRKDGGKCLNKPRKGQQCCHLHINRKVQ